MKLKNTIKFKTLLAISKDKKCTYKSIQLHVLTSQGKTLIKNISAVIIVQIFAIGSIPI